MLRILNKGVLKKALTYLMLVNFINLSANFFQTNNPQSVFFKSLDPIDTVAELVLEYWFEMDDSTIPDTEVPGENQSAKKLKLYHGLYFCEIPAIAFAEWDRNEVPYIIFFMTVNPEIISPPPQHSLTLLA